MSKALTITLYKSELIYDVQNKTYLTGRSRENGNNYEQVANMQAGDDEDHINQILRTIGNSFNELKTKLSNYLSGEVESVNNIQVELDGNMIIKLAMPSNFNQAVSEAISSACHKFIVNTSIAEWFSITKPDEASAYINSAVNNLETIREAINKRIRPLRPDVTAIS